MEASMSVTVLEIPLCSFSALFNIQSIQSYLSLQFLLRADFMYLLYFLNLQYLGHLPRRPKPCQISSTLVAATAAAALRTVRMVVSMADHSGDGRDRLPKQG